MKYFTADTHFGHSNIIKFENQPFRNQFKNIGEHDEFLINAWNSVVKYEDEIYILGDMFFGNIKNATWVIHQLRGRKYFIRGNHDKTTLQLQNKHNCFEWVKDMYELKVPDEEAPKKVQSITLCHYAMIVWNKSHHGAWQLFGHSHGGLTGIREGHHNENKWTNMLSPNQFDVGYDVFQRPISYEEVKAVIKNRNAKNNNKE